MSADKTRKRLLIFSAAVFLFVFFAAGTVYYGGRYYLRSRGAKSRIYSVLSDKLGCKTVADDIVFGWHGMTFKNISFGLGNDKFLYAEDAWLHLNIPKLLHGEIEINGINLSGIEASVTRYRDGSFNMGFLSAGSGKKKGAGAFTVSNIKIRNMRLKLTDEKSDFSAVLDDTSVNINNFSLSEPFYIKIKTEAEGNIGGRAFSGISVYSSVKADLKNCDWKNAAAEGLFNISGDKGGRASVDLEVKDFKNPSIKVAADGDSLDNFILSDYLRDKYNLKNINIDIKALIDPGRKQVVFDKAALRASGASADFSGVFDYSKSKGVYSLKADSFSAEGIAVDLVRRRNGSFNLQELTDFIKHWIQTENTIDFSVAEGRLKDIRFSFTDEGADYSFGLKNLTADIKNFSSDGPFAVDIVTDAGFRIKELKKDGLRLDLRLKPDLKNFDLRKASLVSALKIVSGRARLDSEAEVNNWKNPVISLSAAAKDIGGLLPDGLALRYDLTDYDSEMKWKADIPGKRVELISLKARGSGSSLSAYGKLNYAGRRVKYKANASAFVNLSALREDIPFLKKYGAAGSVDAKGEIVPGDFKIKARLSNAGFHLPGAGLFSGINTDIYAETLKHVSVSSFTAYLNGKPFDACFSMDQRDGSAETDISLTSDDIELEDAVPSAGSAAIPAGTVKKSGIPELLQAWLGTLKSGSVNAEIAVKHFNSSYFSAINLLFKARLTDVNQRFDKVNGTVILASNEGGLKEAAKYIPKIKKSNTVFFNIVKNIDNALGIFQLVGKVKNAVLPDAEIKTHKQNLKKISKTDPKYSYEKFMADISLKNGVSSVNDLYFVSEPFSFRADGTADFRKRTVDIVAHAAAGRAEPDGVLPVVLKIKGPLGDIDTSIGKVSTLSSVILQPFLNSKPFNYVKQKIGLGRKESGKQKDYFMNGYGKKGNEGSGD